MADDERGPQAREITWQVFDLNDLADEFGFDGDDDLGSFIEEADIHVLEDEDGLYVIRAADWRRFVRQTIHEWRRLRRAEVSREVVPVPHDAQFRSEWNDRRTQLLNRHGHVRALVDGFVGLVQDRTADAVRIKQNAQTITLMHRSGVNTGIRLRKDGLWLVGVRGEPQADGRRRPHNYWVRSAGDFERALSFVTGEWDGVVLTDDEGPR